MSSIASTILAFGYHDQNAPRHWNMKRTWEAEGKTVIECHTTKRGFLPKYLDLWRTYRRTQTNADTVLVTFPGHFLMLLAWILTRMPRKKIIFDAFISLYDTNVDDRHRYAKWNPYAWFLFFIDYSSCHLADDVLLDTEAHRQFFIERFSLESEHVRVAYLGTRTDLFSPRTQTKEHADAFTVLFYGTYIPLQGIEHILDAAAILQTTYPHIHFTLIGKGQTRPAMEERAQRLVLKNVSFEHAVAYTELPQRIRDADLCLGIFGTSGKAQRVIPHKVYDAVACGVPVITADTPAIREKFQDGNAVIFCRAGDAKDLAEKIAQCSMRELHNNNQ